MEYVRTIIFVTLLLYTASGEYVDRQQRNYLNARRHCKLATPTINFSIEENTIELSLEDNLNPGGKAWVGYIQDMEIFQYLGCISKDSSDWTTTANTMLNASVGRCWSFCKTAEYLGVQGNDESTACYCISKLNQSAVVACGWSQGNSGYLALGGETTVSVYKKASENVETLLKVATNWTTNKKNCYSYYDPFLKLYRWDSCGLSQPFLCSEDPSGTDVQSTSGYDRWRISTDGCLVNHLYLLPNFTSIESSLNSPHWTSYTRDYIISESTEGISQNRSQYRKYGYIERNATNHFTLKFDSWNRLYLSICEDDHTTSSTAVGQENEKSQFNGDASKGNVGLYVGAPVAILIVASMIIVGLLLYRKRRRSRQKSESPDKNLKDNLTYSRNYQKKSSEQLPNGAEDYHEIDDINRSSLEDYDTIKEADTAPTNNGVNNRGYTAHELTNRSDFKATKSDDYDYAKEPGAIEPVVQHNYHILEKTPHPRALLLERENEIGYNYAKVLPKTEIQVSITKSRQGFNATDTGTDYDHLNDGHGMNKKSETQQRVVDSDNEHIYDKTRDTANTYDHVNNRLDCENAPRGRNTNIHSGNTNIYNKLTDVKLNDDTYNHVNHGQDDNLGEGDYNTTILQKATGFDTDNPYDHT